MIIKKFVSGLIYEFLKYFIEFADYKNPHFDSLITFLERLEPKFLLKPEVLLAAILNSELPVKILIILLNFQTTKTPILTP